MAIVRSAPVRRAVAVVACLAWLAASACTQPRPADKSPRQPAGERVEEPTEPPLPSGSTRASVSTEGKQANGESSTPVLSGTGRYVAFESAASNLVSDDKNGSGDVFVRDLAMNVTERVSISSSGGEGSGHSFQPSISADGRFVAFTLEGSTFGGNGADGVNVYVRDRSRNETTLVSLNADGVPAKYAHGRGMSADGRYVLFEDSSRQYFVRDRVREATSPVPAVDRIGGFSAEGRYVAFTSFRPDLVPGDTNRTYDAFVQDLTSRTTQRVSLDSRGTQADRGSFVISISATGRYVAFESIATNLVPGDRNKGHDVFVRDRSTGQTERVSVDSHGREGNLPSDYLYPPAISAAGRYVAFVSAATNLVLGDSNGRNDVFVRDRSTGRTQRVSVDSGGRQANHLSRMPAISADGRYVAFASRASNLVTDDTNDGPDTFVWRSL